MTNFDLSTDKRAELIKDMIEWWESHKIITKDGWVADHSVEIDDDPNSPFDLWLWDRGAYAGEVQFYVRILPAEIYIGYGKTYD